MKEYDSKKNFKESIKIKQNKEELRIKKLQREYKAGNIREEDLTYEEHKKLIDLYKKQNNELKEKVRIKKSILRKKLNEINEN